MSDYKNLPGKMKDLANTGHPKASELLEKAKQLEVAVDSGTAKQIVGAWARARRLWCECTGEPLI